MVTCLHQGNIYTKRKLQLWGDQKSISLVGAITPLTCAGVKIPRLEGGSIGPRKESCVNCDGPIAVVPCLHQGNIYTKRKLRVWRDQKCIPLVGGKTILTCADRQNTQSRLMRYRVKTLGGTYCYGTVFAPRKYLYQKEATGMERQDMYSVSRCNNTTYLCGLSKYPVLREEV